MPFTEQQFLNIFEKYNLSVWPFQLVLYLLAITAIMLTLFKTRYSDRINSAILSFLWIWMGIAYHLINFTAINYGAYVFGAAFIVQGILFLYFGLIEQHISFRFRYDIPGMTGAILIFFALIAYPLLGSLFGHKYPASPTFGLPCPTTIFTLGILLWTDKKFSVKLIAIPVVWTLVGFTAALLLGFIEDIGLLLSGIAFTLLILYRKQTTKIYK